MSGWDSDNQLGMSFMSGGGVKSFPFEKVGDSVSGEILSIEERQQTDMDTGEPLKWPDGRPRMMFTIILQTLIREDEDDDGQRAIHLRWRSLDAVRKAVRESGAKVPQIGGKLTLAFVGEDPQTKRGYSRPKRWSAQYVPPRPGESMMEESWSDASRQRPRDQAQVYRREPEERERGGVGARPGVRQPPPWRDDEPQAQRQDPDSLSRLRQARNVDHQGRPQSPEAPDWAQPPDAEVQQRRAQMQPLIDQQRAALDRLPADADYRESPSDARAPQDERARYGY